MKHLLQVLAALAGIALVLGGCKKEYSYENPNGSASGTYLWSFGEGSNSYKGPTDTAYLDTLGTQLHLTITGHSGDKKDVISLQLFTDSIRAGAYQTPNCSFDYLRNGALFYGSDITAVGQFTINISAIDSVSITGTFYGTATDTAKKQKTIANGQFKVKFKSHIVSTLPDSSNCWISQLLYTDSTSSTSFYSIASLFNGNTVTNVKLTETPTATVDNNFVVSYPTGKVYLDAAGKQYFAVDGNGRATDFYGYLDPTDSTSQAIHATYSYDGTGHLTRRVVYNPQYPLIALYESDYTWSSNLLTQTVLKSGATNIASVTYSYDASKAVSHFLNLAPGAPEIFLFQSAVGTGVSPDHAITKSVFTYTDQGTGTTTTYTSLFANYSIDSHNYVENFTVSGDDFMAATFPSQVGMRASARYILTYHCK